MGKWETESSAGRQQGRLGGWAGIGWAPVGHRRAPAPPAWFQAHLGGSPDGLAARQVVAEGPLVRRQGADERAGGGILRRVVGGAAREQQRRSAVAQSTGEARWEGEAVDQRWHVGAFLNHVHRCTATDEGVAGPFAAATHQWVPVVCICRRRRRGLGLRDINVLGRRQRSSRPEQNSAGKRNGPRPSQRPKYTDWTRMSLILLESGGMRQDEEM